MKQNDEQIKLLDCTLRDGGFALEDAIKNHIPTDVFSELQLKTVTEHLLNTGIDIIEVGSIEKTQHSKKEFAIYQSIEEISSILPQKNNDNQLFAAFYRGPDTDLKAIPAWKPGMIDVARVCIRYSELKKSLDFCEGLCQKGYKVFIQPMVTTRYKENEIKMLTEYANKMQAYALYFVDSYGYMQQEDVSYYFDRFDNTLTPSIRIGFHAHNNMEMAVSNVTSFIHNRRNRSIIIDTCAMGMGQGTGNAQSEIIMNYLNNNYGKNYSMEEIFKVCDIIEPFNKNQLWGYSPLRFIPAMNEAAYKYAMSLKNIYGLNLYEIQKVLSIIPEEIKYRYTLENTKRLLEKAKGVLNDRS